MAIITLSRQVAAHGDEIAKKISESLGYTFIKRTDIEKRIIDLGFAKEKLPKYDERKPGFFASISKGMSEYINLTRYAVLEVASQNNVVIIGRGSTHIFQGIQNQVGIRFVAPMKTRIERLMKEFDWTEKQAIQRIEESDENRNSFNKKIYDVEHTDPENYHMVLNTGLLSDEECARIIADYVKFNITSEAEELSAKKVNNLYKAQGVINNLLYKKQILIESLRASFNDQNIILTGVTDSIVNVDEILKDVKAAFPEYSVKSEIKLVHDFKAFQ